MYEKLTEEREQLNLKKQLTADERRYTQRNQRVGIILGLIKKVDLFYYVKPGFICVHLRFRRIKYRF